MAGEIGHMTIDDEGPPCHCGNRGCWEALASGTALAKAARKQIEEGADTTILRLAEGKIDPDGFLWSSVVASTGQPGDLR
jgi:glucokinase